MGMTDEPGMSARMDRGSHKLSVHSPTATTFIIVVAVSRLFTAIVRYTVRFDALVWAADLSVSQDPLILSEDA